MNKKRADIAIGERIVVRRSGKRAPAGREIDMHGLRVEDMLPRLDQFLSDAMLEGVPEVRIVHGHGTGALRKAIHERLRGIGVRHFRLGEPGQTPGGDGVTIVSLA
jgi:DNA mismatch repair protein MutS2